MKYKAHKDIDVWMSFDEKKAIIGINFQCDKTMTEDDILLEIRDFLVCYGEGFNFAEVGELVPYEVLFDGEETPEGDYH